MTTFTKAFINDYVKKEIVKDLKTELEYHEMKVRQIKAKIKEIGDVE